MNIVKKALLPVIAGGIFLILYLIVVYKVQVNEIVASNTTWNDDVLYYKQLSAVVHYGYPRGFFGYNESRADIGSFGAWSPVLFYIYALPALLIGTRTNMVLLCNIIFVLVGWSVFVNCTKVSWKRQILIALMLSFMQLPMRYIFSGMMEALGYGIVFAIIGISYSEVHDYRTYKHIALVLLCALYTLIRAYGIAFWIFPIGILIIRKDYKAIIKNCLMGGISLAFNIFFMLRASAPYFSPIVSTDGIQLILSGEINEGIKRYIASLAGALCEAFTFVNNEWRSGRGLGGIAYGSMFFLIIILLVCIIYRYKKKYEISLILEMLLATCLIVFAIFVFYAVFQGARHVLILCVGMTGVIALTDKKFCIIATLGLFIIYMGIKWDEAEYPLRYDAAKAQKMEQYTELFLKEVQVDKESGISWENTIAYDMGVDFNWLFCITDGIGIQFNLGGYLKDSGNQIKSKYIMTQTESDVYDRMICEKYDLIIKTDDFVVFEKNN